MLEAEYSNFNALHLPSMLEKMYRSQIQCYLHGIFLFIGIKGLAM